jgi:hypothetical protein
MAKWQSRFLSRQQHQIKSYGLAAGYMQTFVARQIFEQHIPGPFPF